MKKEVVVKADQDAKNSVVLRIMDAAQEAGYEKLVVAGEPLSKKEQDELKEKKFDNVNAQNEIVVPVTKPEKARNDYASRIPRDEEWID